MKKLSEKKQQERINALMPSGIPRYIRCYDNNGESADRYTIVYTGNYKRISVCEFVGCSEDPFHPLGVGLHGESDQRIDYPSYSHLGKKVKFEDLPSKVQQLVISNYKENWNLV
jgi:hypothetical protein